MRDSRTRRRLRPSVGCALVALCGASCPPPYYDGEWEPADVDRDLAVRICSTLFNCCEDSHLSPGCDEAKVREYLRASIEAAEAAGLIFDPDSFAAGNHTCSEVAEFGSVLQCGPDSQIYHGHQSEGAPCESVGHRMSDCAQGLVCGADRVCHQPCDIPHVAPENGFCGPVRGMWFVTCGPGLVCDDDNETCQPAPAVDEECLSPTTICATEAWCESGTCAVDLPGGSACNDHSQCQSDECRDGICYEPTSAVCGRWAW